jgi:hypothetical protein
MMIVLLAHHLMFNPTLLHFLPRFGSFNLAEGIQTFFGKLNRNNEILRSPWTTRIMSYLMLLLYCIGSKGRIDPNLNIKSIYYNALIGTLIFFGSTFILTFPISVSRDGIYVFISLIGIIPLIKAGQNAARIYHHKKQKDVFNEENETFPQNMTYQENEYSIHYQTNFYYKKKWHKGWINVINPFRATMISGTPGSGKSYTILIQAIWQSIWKGYTAYVYDFKFPTLTLEAYNAYLKTIRLNPYAWGKKADGTPNIPKFYIINLDDMELSHRCNPLSPDTINDYIDANESAMTMMLNLNKKWAKEQGEFFTESAILFVSSIIWYLKIVSDKYNRLYKLELAKPEADQSKVNLRLYKRFQRVCTLPHVIEFACQEDLATMFAIMVKYPSLEVPIRPFSSAQKAGAFEQLLGQLGSAQIGIAKLSSETIYWVMTGDDFSLDINNPNSPKILCTGNNPDRADIYAMIFGLFTSKMLKMVNKQGKLKSALFWDELPTMFVKGIDRLIATARSNKKPK